MARGNGTRTQSKFAPDPPAGPQPVADERTHELLTQVERAVRAVRMEPVVVERDGEPVAVTPEPDPRLDQLASALGDLHSVLLELATRPQPGPQTVELPAIPAPQVDVSELSGLLAEFTRTVEEQERERTARLIDAVKSIRPPVRSSGGSVTLRNPSSPNPIKPATEPTLSSVNGTLTTLDGKTPDQAGTWDYRAGTADTVSITGRVLEVTASAPPTADATVTIDSGNTITIPAGKNWSSDPRGNLVDPSIVFSGTDSFFVGFVS